MRGVIDHAKSYYAVSSVLFIAGVSGEPDLVVLKVIIIVYITT